MAGTVISPARPGPRRPAARPKAAPPPPAHPAGGELPCAGRADLFFSTGNSPGLVEQAKTLCRTACPVREDCLEGALARREPCGIWGGEFFSGGTVVSFRRPRGRPRRGPAPGPGRDADEGFMLPG